MASNTTKVNGASKVTLDSGTFTQQKWTESGSASANTFIIQPTAVSTSLSLTGTSGDIVVVKGYSGDYTSKLSGKVLTLQSDTQTINITLASLSKVTLTFTDGDKTVDISAKTLGTQTLTKVAHHIDGPTAHEIKSLADAAAIAAAHENAALATAATNATAHENAALAAAENATRVLLSNNTYQITSDSNGTSINLTIVNSDRTKTEIYSNNSSDGHQTSTEYKYDSASNLISRVDTDSLLWQDESNISHTKEEVHTLVNYSSGKQAETFIVKNDSQTILSTSIEYDSAGNITSVIEVSADNTKTETYNTDDNNGHKTNEIYNYDVKGNITSSSISDSLTWLDDTNKSHTDETIRTVNVAADASRVETQKTATDGIQTNSVTSQYDANGDIMSVITIRGDKSQTETYTTDDNTHSTTTTYEYDQNGNRISSSDSDYLIWQDDTGTHTKEIIHTLLTNADGTQSESFITNYDGQKIAYTLEDVTSKKVNTSPFDASNADFSFIFAEGNYTFNIGKFNTGDSLIFSNSKVIPIINNASSSDGIVDVIYSNNNTTTTVHLTGITNTQDASIGTTYDGFLNTFSTLA